MNLIDNGDAPLVCKSCLGNETSKRLVKDSVGSECSLCMQPFPTFRWKIADPPISIQTFICKPCASSRNACQACVTDPEYNLPLVLRDAALRILVEEGGHDEDKPDVLRAIKESFMATNGTSKATALEQSSKVTDPLENLHSIIKKLPLPGTPRPSGCFTLCVYGIEEDMNMDAVRVFLKASISKTDYVPVGRYAFFQFSNELDLPSLSGESTIIDGRRIVMAWGDRVHIPKHIHEAVGKVVRHFLRSYTE